MQPTLLAVLALAPVALGQGQFQASPASLSSSPGSDALPFSLGTGTRWQQVHADLIGPPRLLRSLRLRRDELPFPLPASGASSIDIEVLVGEGDFLTAGADFTANFLTAPVQVVPPGPLALPDWTSVVGPVGSFDLVVPFAVPFAYSGQNALVVEVRILNDTQQTTHLADAFAESDQQLPELDLGQGCSGGLLPLRLSASLGTGWAPPLQPLIRLELQALFAPAGLPAFFLVGTTNNSLFVPGLCTLLVPSLDLVVPAVTQSIGPITVTQAPTTVLPFVPATVGLQLFAQAGAIDTAQPGLPFVLSQGQRLTVAAQGPQPLPILRLDGDLVQPAASSFRLGGLVLEVEF
ncbi:MAG: hypothetical protein MUC36_08620 [Planctomycetes bacterium]|jgi:hypothetical protein|nr:hypothetical protein [Planctomycetota bacterium]